MNLKKINILEKTIFKKKRFFALHLSYIFVHKRIYLNSICQHFKLENGKVSKKLPFLRRQILIFLKRE